MFLIPLTLNQISSLQNPQERVPLNESAEYEIAMRLVHDNAFRGYQILPSDSGTLELHVDWLGPGDYEKCTVEVSESKPQGSLSFTCFKCVTAGRQIQSCRHKWATYVLLWQVLTQDSKKIELPKLQQLANELKSNFLKTEDEAGINSGLSVDEVELDSISLILDEPSALKGAGYSQLLTGSLARYKWHTVTKEEEKLSTRLWDLPEIFRRKVSGYSQHYFQEADRLNSLSDLVRYNFSNGLQISAQEILRHPLQRKVLGVLLPQAKTSKPLFAKWPLLQHTERNMAGPALQELEEIMQELLSRLISFHSQGRLKLFLQSKASPTKAMKVESIEFDLNQEVDWRVEFFEKKDLTSDFKLISFRKKPLHFFSSFALEPESGTLIVHPWFREISLLQEVLTDLSPQYLLSAEKGLHFQLQTELEAKIVLKHLRTRQIPIKIEGGSRTLESQKSLTEIRLDEKGFFYLQHAARIEGTKPLSRPGWTSKSALFLQTLSQGLPFLLKTEPKNLASRAGHKRDWDIRLLKHFGILQYLFLEVLSFHFEGELTDGSVVKAENIFESLHEKIQGLLIAGSGSTFVKDVPLTELCSRSVLSCFEEFVRVSLKSITSNEAFYSEQGEVILERAVEREFRVIFELLKVMALNSSGETFRKSRTPFLAKVADGDTKVDLPLTTVKFFFPWGVPSLKGALESVQPLVQHGFRIFVNDQPLEELKEDEFHVDFVIQSGEDPKNFNWFELNPKFFLRGQEVEPDRFLSLGRGGVIEYEGKLYLVPQKQLPSLKRLELFWEKLQKGKTDTSKKQNGEKVYHLPRHQTLELLALRASGIGMRGDAEWKKLCDFYDSLGTKTRTLELPSSMKAELKPYQALGVQWLQDLYQLKLGALLADDMGLGKTLQTLAFLDDLRSKNEMGHVLIVVPSSLVVNWQYESQKFTPDLPLAFFSSRDFDKVSKTLEDVHTQQVVIVTYGLMLEHETFLSQYKWKVLIFDEAQNLKNITTKRTSAARSLTAQFKICLTGTPMENHYGEFYSLIDLLVPGSLGKIDDFRKRFVNTELVSLDEMQDLKLKIKPLMLRRTKKEILDQLPEKQETKISIAFEERQKEIYRDIALSYNRRVQESMEDQGHASVQLQMLTALLRLRQACSDPRALPNVKYDKIPPKIETLVDSLQEIVESGESALVFTQFLQTLEHTAEILSQKNIPVFVLHGAIPTKQRQKILADFNATHGGAVLVMTLKTGGVGLNLTKASYVFHLEPWWNPSVESQATDRAHRLGQTRAVQVFRYIMHESLEEKIEVLKSRKDKKFQSLFTTAEKETEIGTGSSALSKQDFDMLLGLSAE